MIVDVIILACSKTPHLIEVTQNCIDSLHASESEHQFRVRVMESHSEPHFYRGATLVVRPDCEFNYNKYLNIGIQSCKDKWVVLANNDLIFYKNWFTAILEAEKELPEDVKTFSSFARQHVVAKMEDKYYVAYGVGHFFTGWCLTVKREIFDKFKLNEEVNFWCSDNIFQDDLIKHGIKHALIRDSRIDHVGGATLFSMDNDKIHNLTAEQAQIYAKLNK